MNADQALFVVWGPPSHGPRSKVLARELTLDVEFVHVTERRGLFVAPYKYFLQAVRTIRLLWRQRPELVFVQSPPSLAVPVVAAYCAAVGARYVIDAHTDAMVSPWWTRPRWMHRALARRAMATIVTDEHFARQLAANGAPALVIPDIPTSFPVGAPPALDPGFHVLVVSSFADDEPLEEVMRAAGLSPDATYHITGNDDRNPDSPTGGGASNVRFTGFLPDRDYYAMMERVDAVMCLTTRDHTMQRGACEALSVGRPIITSDWPLLRAYFNQGTIHVDNSPESIAAAVEAMRTDHASYIAGIRNLRAAQQEQWHHARLRLAEMVGV